MHTDLGGCDDELIYDLTRNAENQFYKMVVKTFEKKDGIYSVQLYVRIESDRNTHFEYRSLAALLNEKGIKAECHKEDEYLTIKKLEFVEDDNEEGEYDLPARNFQEQLERYTENIIEILEPLNTSPKSKQKALKSSVEVEGSSEGPAEEMPSSALPFDYDVTVFNYQVDRGAPVNAYDLEDDQGKESDPESDEELIPSIVEYL